MYPVPVAFFRAFFCLVCAFLWLLSFCCRCSPRLFEIKHVGFCAEILADARHRTLDPLFAVAVGVAAAGMRIQREEREKGRKGDVAGILRMLKRRGVMKWKGEI